MARFSIGTAIGEAFGLMRRRPLAVFVWGLLMVAPSVASIALILPMLSDMVSTIGSDSAGHEQFHGAMMGGMMQLQGVASLLNLLQLLLMVIVYTAIMRAVVRPAETSFFSLRLGMDELRVAIVGLAIIVGFYVLLLIAVLLGVGIGFAAWSLGEPFNWLVIAALCVGLMLATWLGAARVSLMAPASVLHRTFAFEEGWKLARGQAGTLFGMLLLIVLIVLVIEVTVFGIGATIVAISASGPDWSQIHAVLEDDPFAGLQTLFAANWPWVAGCGVVLSAIYGVLITLAIAPFASACRQLTGNGVSPAGEPSAAPVE